MPKKAREMTALEVKRLQHPDPESGQKVRYSVGGVNGLYYVIGPTNTRSWLWRYTYGGRRKSIGLGPFPDVTLAMARDRAREMADHVWRGIDPRAERSSLRPVMTFSDAVDGFAADKLAEIKNEKHRKQYVASLRADVVPIIGKLSVADISTPDILRVLKPIWLEKTESARRLRGRIEKVLAWATVSGFREGDNPARWKNNLDHMLPKPSQITNRAGQPAIQLDQAAQWMQEIRSREGFATRALEFLALTTARSGEVRGMVWSEINLEAGIWIVPAARMKANNEHRVALSSAAIEILSKLPRLPETEYVFPAPRGGKLSDMSISACMKRIHSSQLKIDGKGYVDRQTQRPAVPHGLRSTFRDWVAERTEYPRDMAEIALAHQVGSEVERAYRRSDMIEKRRAMMEDWSGFLNSRTQVRSLDEKK